MAACEECNLAAIFGGTADLSRLLAIIITSIDHLVYVCQCIQTQSKKTPKKTEQMVLISMIDKCC